GRARARLTVAEPLLNFMGTLHGGAIATLVDDMGSIAVLATDRYRRLGVTTDLNVSYLAAAKPGEVILAEAEGLQSGLTMAFVEVRLKREPRGELIACGRMTKLLGERPLPPEITGAGGP